MVLHEQASMFRDVKNGAVDSILKNQIGPRRFHKSGEVLVGLPQLRNDRLQFCRVTRGKKPPWTLGMDIYIFMIQM